MKIIHRLPYFPEHTAIIVGGDRVDIQRYQIIVWVSIAHTLAWDPRTPAFPAILDPGNNFNFSIFEYHLIHWAGIRPELLRVLGRMKEKGKRYPRHEADVWLHRNRPGSQARDPEHEPFRLTLDKGMVIYLDEQPNPPHLPLLGLRALSDNNLHTVIDGERREVSVHTPNWIARVLRAVRLPPY